MQTDAGLYYDDWGHGDATLVLLHYFGSSGATWRPIQERLGPGIRCIAPHLRGFGQSAGVQGRFRIADSVADLLQLLRQLGLRRYRLVGHSMGGKIALALAAAAPPGLESLVLLAPSPPTPEPMTDADREAMRARLGNAGGLQEHLSSICHRPLPQDVLENETNAHLQTAPDAWNAWLDEGSREDITALLPAIAVPTLLIDGEKDGTIQPAVVKTEVAGRLRRVRSATLARTGHLLHLEQPGRIATLLRRRF